MYVLSFFKKVDTTQGGTLFKGGHYLRKYGMPYIFVLVENETESKKVSFLFAQSKISVDKTFNDMVVASQKWVEIDAMIDSFSNL